MEPSDFKRTMGYLAAKQAKFQQARSVQKLKEDLFQNFSRVIESVNVVIATYFDKALGDVQVFPDKGTVAFGSGLHGWAFTIRQFAAKYAKKFGVDKNKMMTRLWVRLKVCLYV